MAADWSVSKSVSPRAETSEVVPHLIWGTSPRRRSGRGAHRRPESGRAVFGGEEDPEILPAHIFKSVPLDLRHRAIERDDPAVRIEQRDCVVAHALDNQTQPLLLLP